MERIKKIIEFLKKRHKARKADFYGSIAFGSCFRLAPPSFFILNDKETVRRELDRAECEALEALERNFKEEAIGIREDRAKRIKAREAQRIRADEGKQQQGIEAETLILTGKS
ncbi:MAG: hypothetical protein NC541_12690 [bacterium]|nr:hypothetical protein [bacterium]